MALVQRSSSARWAELTKAQFVPSYVEGRPEMALKKWCAYARAFKDNTSFSQEQLLKRPEVRYSQEYSNIRQRASKEPSSDIPDDLIRSLALKFRVKVVDLPEADAALSSREQRASARRQSEGDEAVDADTEDTSAAGGGRSGGARGSSGDAGTSGRGGSSRGTGLLTQRLPAPAAASAPAGAVAARGKGGKAKMPADGGAAAKQAKKAKKKPAAEEESGDEEGRADVSINIIEDWMMLRLPSLVQNDNANADDADRDMRGELVASDDVGWTHLSYLLALDDVRPRFRTQA